MTALDFPDPYPRFCAGIRELCELDLTLYKRGQMERRIRSFAARRGVHDLLAYLDLLRQDTDERGRFVDRLTINVSQLWRNPEQWRSLADEIVPALAARGRIRAWSAGSSYGAEAYTVAAILRERAPGAQLSVLGWDLDARMVERARAGWFSAEDARDAPREQLERWFEPVDGGWRGKPELRLLCTFEVRNLLADGFPRDLDLVLCRNTVIYFEEDVRDALHARLAASLRPGGYLVVGATERVSDPVACGLERTLPFVYRRDR